MNKLVILIGLALSLIASGKSSILSSSDMDVVLRIAKAIHTVNPRLSEKKYMEYALGIYRASKKYEIEPLLLISIAQQETTFRENLPEGKAGERGICQIRKNWLLEKTFIKEFGYQTVDDLENPAKNFLAAAWILKNLKKDAKSGALPYWAYYNSVKFNNRLKYFLGVSRFLNQIRNQKVVLTKVEFPKRTIAAENKSTYCVTKANRKRTHYPFPTVIIPRLVKNDLFKSKIEGPIQKTYYAFESSLQVLP